MTKTTEDMAKELKLNEESIKFGLKKKPKEVSEAVKKAYEFMNRKRSKK